MDLLDKTIQQDFGVSVDANMEVDFFRFIALIDRLGGLDLELTQEEADWLNGTTGDYWQSEWNADAGISNAGWNLHAGWNSMTAGQVTDYCRLRVVGKSDWERTERQRTVIMEILRKVRLQSPMDQIRFIHSAMPLIRTDLGIGTLFRLGMAALFHRFDTFENNRIPAADAYRSANIYSSDYGNLTLLIPDLPKNAETLQNSIYG
jgi:anionic cell wall polymer biosynthesis LytR-Cps2A-Psr (LCP) family protein